MTTINLFRAVLEQALGERDRFQAELAALRAALAQQAEPVAGKVVAWGVFANIDGEWQLQHPVFAGDECGKENAEFERASYSGPQSLEVRPLGVVTAAAQQAEPVPFGCVTVRRLSLRHENHADQYQFYPAGQSPYLDNVDECHTVYTVPPQQAEPVEPVAWANIDSDRLRVDPATGNVSIGAQQAEPVEPVAIADGTFNHDCPIGTLLYTAPPQRKPLTEGVLMGVYIDFDRTADPAWSRAEYLLRLFRAVERAHGIKE